MLSPHFSRLSALISLFALVSACFGQNLDHTFPDNPLLKMRQVRDRNGEIRNIVSDIVKDSKGRFWLATLNGVVRFDGNETETFRLPEIRNGLLQSNSISELCLYQDTLLYAANSLGICSINLKTFSITPIDLDKPDKTMAVNFYFVMADQKGDIWASTMELGLMKLNRAANRFEKPKNKLLALKDVKTHQLSGKDEINFVHRRGIIVYNIRTGATEDMKEPGNSARPLWDSTADANVSSFLIRDTSTYVCKRFRSQVTYNFFRYNNVTGKKYRYEIPSFLGRFFAADSRGNIWIYGDGLSVIEAKTGRMHHLDADQEFGFSFCLNIYEDNEHNIWMCTNNGLFSYNLDELEIRNMSRYENNQLQEYVYQSFCTLSNGDAWFGTYGHGIMIHDSTLQFKSALTFPKEKGDGLNVISCIAQDKLGNIWIGCVLGKVIHYDYQKKTYKIYEDPALGTARIMSIIETSDGRLFFVTQEGGIVLREKDGRFKTVYSSMNDSNNPVGQVMNSVMYKDSLLLIATLNTGFYTFNVNTLKKEVYKMDPGNAKAISSNNYISVQLHGDLAYVGTENGLNEFDPATGTFRKLFKGVSVPFSEVYSAVPIDKNILIAVTSDGLYKVNLGNNTFSRVGRGTMLDASNYSVAYLEKRNTLVFYTDNFIYTLKYKAPPAPFKPTCFIYHVKVRDSTIFVNTNEEQLTVRRDQNTLSIQLGTNTFKYGEYMEYEYRVNDEDWQKLYHNRFFILHNLKGGEYVIHVRCRNIENNIYSEEVSVRVLIEKAFHETFLFYILIAFILIISGYLFYRIRVNRLLAVERIRFKLSRDLHDDMGSTLSTINILSSIAQKNLNTGTSNQAEYLDKIATYSHDMMESMDDIVWSLNPSNDSLNRVVAKMREFANTILEPKKIKFNFEVGNGVEDTTLRMEYRRDFFLIFKEAINNAAKYSHATTIDVTLHLEQGQLKMKISDNGRGFRLDEVGSGNGLTNMRRRAESIKAKLLIDTKLNTGTTVKLTVKVS